jgi:hypothetical protein
LPRHGATPTNLTWSPLFEARAITSTISAIQRRESQGLAGRRSTRLGKVGPSKNTLDLFGMSVLSEDSRATSPRWNGATVVFFFFRQERAHTLKQAGAQVEESRFSFMPLSRENRN